MDDERVFDAVKETLTRLFGWEQDLVPCPE
jgi:hypothetical protein